MYIPKKNRLEMFLKRKVSTSSRKSNSNSNNKNASNNHNNWSETCTDFIKDVLLLRRRISSKSNKKNSINDNHVLLLDDPNFGFDQLSEFQKSYVSFPEFNESAISAAESITDSECSTNTQQSNQHNWGITSSFSFSSYTLSRI